MISRFRFWLRDKLPHVIVLTLILIILVIFFWPRIFISIKPGEAGVLYRRFFGGTVIDRIYPERLHIINPFNIMYIYNIRQQLVRHDMVALSVEGLPLRLMLAIRFKPEYDMLGLLHQQVGPEYVDRIVVPQVESVLRRNIAEVTAEAIYTNREGVLTNIILLAIEEVGRNFVLIEDIIIRTIELPDPLQASIERKLVQEQILKTYDFVLATEAREAERKAIEADGIRNYQNIISQTLTEQLIRWQGVQATLELSTSDNAKVVVVGGGEDGLPIILGSQ